MKYIITVIGLIGIIIIIAFVVTRNSNPPQEENNEPIGEIEDTNESAPSQPEGIAIIRMTKDGFTPSDVTVKVGDTVAFFNIDDQGHWPASDPHPDRTDFPEFDVGREMEPGSTWNYLIMRPGVWKYHDHLNPLNGGTVTVLE